MSTRTLAMVIPKLQTSSAADLPWPLIRSGLRYLLVPYDFIDPQLVSSMAVLDSPKSIK